MSEANRMYRHFTRPMALVLLGVFLALRTTQAIEPSPKIPALHVVSVGIMNAIGQHPLVTTEKDALDVAKWARGQQGKLFERVDAKTLTNERATHDAVLAALSKLPSTARADDYSIVYISTHGGRNAKTGVYEICCYDRRVSWNEIKDALSTVRGTKIVILDTCDAGAILNGSNLIVFSACLADQSSADGTGPKGNSLCTKYMLEALNGKADTNHNGIVSLSEMVAYVSGKLENDSANRPAKEKQSSTLFRPENIPDALPLSKVALSVDAAVAPASKTPTNKGSAVVNLAGTTWSGVENAGTLRFEFLPNGKATMFDAVNHTPVHGSYAVQDTKVTIRFNNYTYIGRMARNSMSGHATGDNNAAWDFRLSKQ